MEDLNEFKTDEFEMVGIRCLLRHLSFVSQERSDSREDDWGKIKKHDNFSNNWSVME